MVVVRKSTKSKHVVVVGHFACQALTNDQIVDSIYSVVVPYKRVAIISNANNHASDCVEGEHKAISRYVSH